MNSIKKKKIVKYYASKKYKILLSCVILICLAAIFNQWEKIFSDLGLLGGFLRILLVLWLIDLTRKTFRVIEFDFEQRVVRLISWFSSQIIIKPQQIETLSIAKHLEFPMILPRILPPYYFIFKMKNSKKIKFDFIRGSDLGFYEQKGMMEKILGIKSINLVHPSRNW